MSFREVKSMLRMINIDMDDVYAYKLFKVPVLCSITRCPPLLSPSAGDTFTAGSFSAFPSAENCQTHHTQSHPPSPMVDYHQWWGELSRPLLCGSSRCDIFPSWGAVPMGISQGPFPLGKLRHGALLCSAPPQTRGSEGYGWGDRGDMAPYPPRHNPSLSAHASS